MSVLHSEGSAEMIYDQRQKVAASSAMNPSRPFPEGTPKGKAQEVLVCSERALLETFQVKSVSAHFHYHRDLNN
jgi:hypothetical protein